MSYNRLSVILFASLFVNQPSFSADRKVASTVISATVYSDRALIERAVHEQLPAGQHTLVVTGLPTTLIDQSLRVSGSSDSPAKILDVKIETVFLDTVPEARIRQLQDRLKNLKNEQQQLADKLSILRSQKDYVDSLRVYSARAPLTEGAKRASSEEWDRMLGFIDKKLGAIFAEMRDTNPKMDEVKAKIEAVEREIRQSQAYSKQSQKQVKVELELSRASRVRLSVSYVLLGASWVPTYEARVSGNAKTLQLTYSGMVRQSTNEDWSNIQLTLSTAQPAMGGSPPELYPWYVDVAQPRPLPMEGRMDKMRLPSAVLRDEAKREEVETAAVTMEVPAAVVQTHATSTSFKIPSTSSIPSDNNPHKVTIALQELPVSLEYFAVPKLSPSAYLKGKVKNTTEAPFLAGSMNVFFENAFVATSNIPTVMPGEEFESFLGVDEGIRIERKLLNRLTEYSGLFSKKMKVTYDVLIKVENKKNLTVELNVRDQIPISRNEKIVVEMIAPSPKELAADAAGMLNWKLKLNPGDKRELPLKFSVEYPSDLRISGLE